MPPLRAAVTESGSELNKRGSLEREGRGEDAGRILDDDEGFDRDFVRGLQCNAAVGEQAGRGSRRPVGLADRRRPARSRGLFRSRSIPPRWPATAERSTEPLNASSCLPETSAKPPLPPWVPAWAFFYCGTRSPRRSRQQRGRHRRSPRTRSRRAARYRLCEPSPHSPPSASRPWKPPPTSISPPDAFAFVRGRRARDGHLATTRRDEPAPIRQALDTFRVDRPPRGPHKS